MRGVFLCWAVLLAPPTTLRQLLGGGVWRGAALMLFGLPPISKLAWRITCHAFKALRSASQLTHRVVSVLFVRECRSHPAPRFCTTSLFVAAAAS